MKRAKGEKSVFSFGEIVGQPAPGDGQVTALFKIRRADEEERLAFGWAYVAQDEEGEQTEDWSGDQLDPAELEEAAYRFVELYREGGEMHQRGGVGVLVESVVFTANKMAALGIPEGTLPVGWWIGFRVTDEDVWAKVKDGTYSMLSIEGEAVRVEISDE